MFKNLTTREKLLFNMILSQTGLIAVGILGYLGYTMAAVGVVVLFSIIIAYSSYQVMDSTTKGIKKFDNLFEEFINFVLMKQNRIMKESNPGNDDIGKMISKVNDAIDTLQTSMRQDMQVMGEIVLTTDKIEQGIFQCKVKGITTNPMLATLKVNMNKMIEALGKTVSEVSEVANSYANDDFTKKIVISSAMRDEMRLLLESVNKLGDSLSNNAKSNLSNGQQLDINSQTMTESVNSLASKANQQAASLEETAAAVEEITSITRNNAGNATKMSTLGQQVQDEVQSGMNLAGETSSAMDQINEQVRAINESITVIDQIAFQTNILSLNAAVEAATAGESGKGFAVVAGEVRNLASRSADAANEIKALVEQATIKANDGKSISDRMISGYESLNENFTQTMDLIEDVSSASKEQMTGIEQINDAVATLDKMTQENAHEANSVANTASEVSKMAKSLVSDAKTKRFNDKIA